MFEWEYLSACINAGVTYKRLCHRPLLVRDYVLICVRYLSQEPQSASEFMMSCGTYACPAWQTSSEDSSLSPKPFTKPLIFYWRTCSSMCWMQTATACFFSTIISRISSRDGRLASWWKCNCFPVHRLILRCVTGWALVASQMKRGEQTCLCVKIRRAVRLDNLMSGKLCLTAKVGWLFADFIILSPPPPKKRKDKCLLNCCKQNV